MGHRGDLVIGSPGDRKSKSLSSARQSGIIWDDLGCIGIPARGRVPWNYRCQGQARGTITGMKKRRSATKASAKRARKTTKKAAPGKAAKSVRKKRPANASST